jgi:hypothetical protein
LPPPHPTLKALVLFAQSGQHGVNLVCRNVGVGQHRSALLQPRCFQAKPALAVFRLAAVFTRETGALATQHRRDAL